MKTIFKKLFSYALSISLWFFTGCSGGDEPKPFDCDTSDLALSVSASSNPTTCGATDGSITVTATGGSEPYQYKKSSGTFGNSNVFSGFGAGTFTFTVKDKNGCTAEVSESLELPGLDPLTATSIIVADSECLTDNGSITVDASGGTGPYQYKLGTGAFVDTEVFNGLSSGNKTITVKDAADCIFTLNVTVPSGEKGITYEGEILAIFVAKCQFAGCHPDNGNWFDYTTAKNNAATIKTRTGNGSMPKSPQPGGALSASQIALIACWVDDGAPQN